MPGLLESLEEKKAVNLPSQIFGVTTYDSLFKWIFDDEEIRCAFFSDCIPNLHIRSSTLSDEHMNPLKDLENLRHFMGGKEQEVVANELYANQDEMEVSFSGKPYNSGTQFVKEIVSHFKDIQKAFPKIHYDGALDFVCTLDTGDLALVEMQITPDDDWDRRALAYIASTYSRQMRKGMVWKEIRTVIGINILGGGLNDEKHWKETPNQYTRHYKLQEQINKEEPPRFLEHIQIIQFCLANVPWDEIPQRLKEWLLLFRRAHKMTEEEVELTIHSPVVLAAFERAKLSNLPEKIMRNYEEEETKIKNLSGHIASERAEGLKEGMEKGLKEGLEKGTKNTKKEVARNLLKNNIDISIIATATGLSQKEIESLFS